MDELSLAGRNSLNDESASDGGINPQGFEIDAGAG